MFGIFARTSISCRINLAEALEYHTPPPPHPPPTRKPQLGKKGFILKENYFPKAFFFHC
jgi:hypothetical protein